jgi:hypothetical protein
VHGNHQVQRFVQEQRSRPCSSPRIARKAAVGGSCSSAPSEEEAAQAEARQAQTEEEPEVMAMSIDRTPWIQRYALSGFSPAEKAKMDAAIPIALDTVEGCDDIGWVKTKMVKDTLRTAIYILDPEQKECGWTFPTSPYIKIGKSAFNHSSCCKLESTLAHEASHVSFSTESGARELEKDCFSCPS